MEHRLGSLMGRRASTRRGTVRFKKAPKLFKAVKKLLNARQLLGRAGRGDAEQAPAEPTGGSESPFETEEAVALRR